MQQDLRNNLPWSIPRAEKRRLCYIECFWTQPMTPDEELTHLEDSIRRLKIEFDVFFSGGSPRPPTDSQWRVETTLKKYSDASRLTFAQRFRYNGLASRYALFSELWRQKMRIREQGGPRRPVAEQKEGPEKEPLCRVEWRDPSSEPEKVEKLFTAFVKAKQQCGEATENLAPEAFKRFVQQKTAQLQKDMSCEQVEYVVEVDQGQVRLKAKRL
ncbi:MAG: hypothetical protein A3H27_04955 [Acidobacteria bacterium RIFCSPLOWO2_02_FULL_59_13]|nr:MAG: hypothetical protein A3H27_04955 [Acidobacteria bacterium RIFCSPLOWO2_02_FULL_59_13]